jgi:ATP-binding cassette subfamily A (ABC1) protein 3
MFLAFVGKTVAIIIWLVTSLNFFSSAGTGVQYLICIFPNWGLLMAINVMFQYERSSRTLSYAQLYQSMFGDYFTLGGVLLAQMLWTLFYIPLTWYIERIFPGEYGAPQPFYFPFMVCIYFQFDKLESIN